MSFRSGEDSHIQLTELVLCPRKLSPSKETHRQAAELPEAELKGDSRKKKYPSSRACPVGRAHRASENLCVSTRATGGHEHPGGVSQRITDHQQKEIQQQ